jgi:hypothetical protein
LSELAPMRVPLPAATMTAAVEGEGCCVFKRGKSYGPKV